MTDGRAVERHFALKMAAHDKIRTFLGVVFITVLCLLLVYHHIILKGKTVRKALSQCRRLRTKNVNRPIPAVSTETYIVLVHVGSLCIRLSHSIGSSDDIIVSDRVERLLVSSSFQIRKMSDFEVST